MIATRYAGAIAAEVPPEVDTDLLRALLNLELATAPQFEGGV